MRQEKQRHFFLVGGLILALFLAACRPSAPTPQPSPAPAVLPSTAPSATLPRPSPTPAQTPTIQIPQASATPQSGPTACTEKGIINEASLQSQVLEREIPINIYLPPCFESEPQQPYPVVYLLHGFDTDQNQWPVLGLRDAADALMQDPHNTAFLVVMPYIAQPNLSALERNQAFFMDELMPFIEANYPVRAERGGRAIGGISRGASWALRLGLLPELPFGRIGAHSLPPLAGEVEAWVTQLAAMPPTERPLLFIDIGNNDKDLEPARDFDLELTKAAIPHIWYMFAGYHDAAYWQEHLPIYLEFYAQAWPAAFP